MPTIQQLIRFNRKSIKRKTKIKPGFKNWLSPRHARPTHASEASGAVPTPRGARKPLLLI